MPSKPKPKALPAHLEEFLALLEEQALAGAPLDRVGALQAVEAKHKRLIDIEAELAEHEAAAERFQRIWKRVTMGLEDAAINSAKGGKGSATTILRGMGALKAPTGELSRGGNGRLQLERSHAARVNECRKW